MPRHAHEFAHVTLVLSGSVREKAGRREFDARAGDVVFKPAGESHADRFGPRGLQTLSLQLGIADGAMRLPAEGAMLPSRYLDYTWFDGGPVPRAMTQLLRHVREGACSFDLAGAAYDVLAALDRDEPGDSRDVPGWLRLARERLHDDPCVQRVGELAAACGVHPVHRTRVFRRCYGVSVSEYLQRRRTRLAMRRLLDTDEPLASVAVDAGFADQSHLTRTFQRRFGVTPGRYRALLRTSG